MADIAASVLARLKNKAVYVSGNERKIYRTMVCC